MLLKTGHEFLFLFCMTIFIYLLKGGSSIKILGFSLLMLPAVILFTLAEETADSAPVFLGTELLTMTLLCVIVRDFASRNALFIALLIFWGFSLYARSKQADNLLTIPHLHGLILIFLTSIIASSLSLRPIILCCYVLGFFYMMLFFLHRVVSKRKAFFKTTSGIRNADTEAIEQTISHTAMRSFLTGLCIIMLLGFYKLAYPDLSAYLEPAYTYLTEKITEFFDEDIPTQEETTEYADTTEQETSYTELSESVQTLPTLKVIYFIFGGILLLTFFFLFLYFGKKLFARLGSPKRPTIVTVDEHLISEEHIELAKEKKKRPSYKETHTTAGRVRFLYKTAIQKYKNPEVTLLESLTPAELEEETALSSHPSCNALHKIYETARYSNLPVSDSEYHELKRAILRKRD